jgi:uncharacterized protein (TIGR02145 family)
MRKILLLLAFAISLYATSDAQQYGSFKDPRDGQVYKTVIIRDQEWMSENLNTIKFRNGDLIPEAKTWEELVLAEKNKKPAWYAANLHPFINPNSMSIGKFYNWYAVIDPRELAPQGWNIPTNIEWEKLRKGDNGDPELDPVADYWTKKEDWIHLGVDHNDIYSEERGFSGLPTSNIGLVPIGAYWWSKTQFDTKEANVFCIGVIPFLFNVSKFPKYYSLSVRCVRRVNNTTPNKTESKQNNTINYNGNIQNNDCDNYLKEFNSITNRLINWYNTNNLKAIENTYQESQLALKNIQSCYSNPYYKNKADAILARWKKAYDDCERRIRSGSSSSLSKPGYGDVNTNNYTVSVNAWQCSKCGVLSKGQQQPGRYDNGNCTIGSTHTYGEANTTQGYQCKKCGRKYYLLNKGRGERGPCCGEFGNCSIGTNHDWRAF